MDRYLLPTHEMSHRPADYESRTVEEPIRLTEDPD